MTTERLAENVPLAQFGISVCYLSIMLFCLWSAWVERRRKGKRK